jgi:fumarate hydratase class II
MRPIIINKFLRSSRILGDACEKLRCSPSSARGSAIAHIAIDQDLTLREVALALSYIDAKRHDQFVDPKKVGRRELEGD